MMSNIFLILGKVVAGAVVTVAAPSVILSLLGFGSAGVAAGSVAAGIQSTIGNVAAGSAFAAMQSAGAAGIAAGIQAALAAGGAAIGGVLAFFF